MFKRLMAPISVQWELTAACNLNCVHCYNYWRGKNETPSLPVITNQPNPEKVADELINNKVFHVTLTGGEPLLVMHKYRKTLLRLRDAGIDLHCNSNLALLNPKRLQLLQEIGVRSILTSIMGHEASVHNPIANAQGSFEKTVAGIRLAIERGFRVGVNMVVTKKNLPHVYATGAFAQQLGVTCFSATKALKPATADDFSDYQLSRQELNQMFQDLVDVRNATGVNIDSLEHYPACAFPNSQIRSAFGTRNCSAAKTCCTIGFDGAIRPCSHAPQEYGNIVDGLEPAWIAMDDWRKGEYVPVYCKNECKEYPLMCGGGCRIEAKNHSGSYTDRDPYCLGKESLHQMTRKKTGLSIDARFEPTQGLRFRAEIHGCVVFLSNIKWLLLDPVLAEFLHRHQAQDSNFAPSEVGELYNANIDQIRPTLTKLFSKGLICKTNP